MIPSGDVRFDAALREGWAVTVAESVHLDEAGWQSFLEGRLDPDARESALDHVANCPRCADVFKAARAAALTEVAHHTETRRPASRHSWPQLAALAATVVMGTVLVTRSSNEGPVVTPPSASSVLPLAPPARPRLEKAPVVVSAEQLLAVRGGSRDNDYLKALATALDPYEKDRFAEAATRLAPLVRDRPRAFEPAFYLGVSLVLDGRAAESVPVLERALELSPDSRREEVTRWLAAARTR